MILAIVKRWWRVATDVLVLLLLGCLALFLELAGMKGLSVRRGFFCDDESIRYPYQPHPAVPTWALVVGTLSISITTVGTGMEQGATVLRRVYIDSPPSISLSPSLDPSLHPFLSPSFFPPSLPLSFPPSLPSPTPQIILGNCYERYCIKRPDCQPLKVHRRLRVSPWVIRTGYHLRWFLLGAVITVLITDLVKVVIGRLRPHFISACEPNFGEFNCTDQFGNPVYVTDYKCMGHKDLENESR